MSSPQEPPRGSTQTPVEGRYKLEGAGAEKHAAGASSSREEKSPAAAPQPQNISASDDEDAEMVRRELGHLKHQIYASTTAAAEKKSGEVLPPKEEATKQKGADQAVGAADAGAAAVELVEGVVEAAARRLGIGEE